MTPELPDGLKVWFEYTVTIRSPQGRLLAFHSDNPKFDRYDRTYRRCVIAHVVDAETREQVAQGMAVCNPCDQFVKKVGRVKALGRALGDLSRQGRGPGWGGS